MPHIGNLARRMRSYWLQDASFVTLLFMLGFTIFILPTLLEQVIANPQTLHVSLMLIFLVGIWSATRTWLLVSAVILFVCSLVLNILCLSSDQLWFKHLLWVSYSLNTFLFIITNISLLFRDNEINFSRVLGAVNVYLLFGLLGAFLFELLHAVYGSSLSGDIAFSNTDEDFSEFIYYSMVSLTTVGYGDIQPVNAAARSLSIFLSTLGLLYPAVVIAKLVSGVSQQSHQK